MRVWPHLPYAAAISGGCDSTIVRWDASSGRQLAVHDFGTVGSATPSGPPPRPSRCKPQAPTPNPAALF